MRKFYLFLTALAVSISVFAAEFTAGGAKYVVLPDGTAELKEFKKATGDVVIPEKVTDPKGGAEYTVTAIGKGAFKKAPMTTITLPSTVKTLGDQAFMDCKNLTTANLPESILSIPDECFRGCKALTAVKGADTMETVGNFAFCETAMPGIRILDTTKRIGFRAFSACDNLKGVQIDPSAEPLKMEPGVFYGSPVENAIIYRDLDYLPSDHLLDKYRLYNNNPALELLIIGADVDTENWKNALDDCPNANVVFMDEHAGLQALNFFQNLAGGKHAYFIGAEIENNELKVLHGADPDPIATANENINLQNFLAKLQEFVRVAVEEPSALPNQYRKISKEESVKYNDYLRNAIRVLCDEVYFAKPSLTPEELENLRGFINNYFMFIGADYGFPNLDIWGWTREDILNKDIASGEHKDDYERILMAIDRLYSFSDRKDEPYHATMQLAALCALERWEEAAKYYPTVCRLVTEDGQYYQLSLPSELTYLQNAINEHGYKAVTPNFKKATAKSGDNGSAIQFFMKKAIEAGVEAYKNKKAEKEFRELYYESIGLDKKGRPKK